MKYQGTSWQMLTMFWIHLTSIDNLHSATGCFMMGSFISWLVNNPQQSMGSNTGSISFLISKKSTKVKCPLLTKQPSQECELSVMSVGRILLCSSKALLGDVFGGSFSGQKMVAKNSGYETTKSPPQRTPCQKQGFFNFRPYSEEINEL